MRDVVQRDGRDPVGIEGDPGALGHRQELAKRTSAVVVASLIVPIFNRSLGR
jgi:hypothetical protein